MVLAGELGQLLDHDAARRHVDAERQRLGCEHDLQQSAREPFLDGLLHRWHEPGVMRGQPGLEPRDPRVVAEDVEVFVGETGSVALGDPAQRPPFGGRRQPQPRRDALVDGLIAPRPTEHEHDRGQHLLVGEALHDFAAPRRVQPRPPAASARERTLVETLGDRVRRRLAALVGERRHQMQLLRGPITDHVQVDELDRPAFLDDRLGLAADRLHPRRDLFGVRDGRGERDDADLLGEVDDHLLPHRAARRVLQIVDLVQHDGVQAVERGRSRVDHVAEHLGGHHHDRRVAVDHVVAGQQPHAGGAVRAGEVTELLVRERLQRCGVEGLAACGERLGDRVLGDQRLPRAGRRGHEDGAADVERVERPDLERVERKRPRRREPGADRSGRHGAGGTVVADGSGASVVEVSSGGRVVDVRSPGSIGGGGGVVWRSNPPGQRIPPSAARSRMITTPAGSTMISLPRHSRCRRTAHHTNPTSASDGERDEPGRARLTARESAGAFRARRARAQQPDHQHGEHDDGERAADRGPHLPPAAVPVRGTPAA